MDEAVKELAEAIAAIPADLSQRDREQKVVDLTWALAHKHGILYYQLRDELTRRTQAEQSARAGKEGA